MDIQAWVQALRIMEELIRDGQTVYTLQAKVVLSIIGCQLGINHHQKKQVKLMLW